jgi:large repetitive protein
MSSIRQRRTTRQMGGWMGRLGRRLGLQIIVCTFVALVLVCRAQGAVFNIAAGDVTALIDAINTANGNNEDDTINLAAGTYTLTAADNEITGNGPNGLPSITSSINMRGAGADSTVIARDAGALAFRIFHVAATGVLRLRGVTITGGRSENDSFGGGGIFTEGHLTLTNSIIKNNTAIREGGGLSNFKGIARLINSMVSDNTANTNAGGIVNNDGKMTLITSTVSGNTAPVSGAGAGGIYNFNESGIFNDSGTKASATLTLINSSVSDNTAGGDGGGINGLGPRSLLRVTNSIINGNSGTFGGGIRNRNGSQLTLVDSKVISNTAESDGGGINNINVDSKMIIRRSLIAANRANNNGGGISNEDDGSVSVHRSFIIENEAGNGGGVFNDNGIITLIQTIIADNVPNDCIGCP